MINPEHVKHRIEALEDDLEFDDEKMEIVLQDEVVATPWEPNAPDWLPPSPGVTETRYRRDKCGEWVED